MATGSQGHRSDAPSGRLNTEHRKPNTENLNMPAEPTYSPSTDAMAAQLDGEAVLLHLGSKQYFRLNETAAEVWAALEAGVGGVDGLTDWLCERFDVTPEVASAEVVRLLVELEERGLVNVVVAS